MSNAVNFDHRKIILKRGLGAGGPVQLFIASEIIRRCDPYTPMQQGTLKQPGTSVQIIENGKAIRWNGPYARYLYYGKLMIGEHSRSAFAKLGERKALTDKDLTFHGAPRRGAFWVKRMLEDQREDLRKAVANFAGGK